MHGLTGVEIRERPMQLPRWSYPFVCVMAVAALYLAALRPAIDDVTSLERLLHKIEHAPALSAETTATVDRMIEKVRARADVSEHAKARREAAIARVLDAIRAKQTIATAGAI
jgi:hypothetical protein